VEQIDTRTLLQLAQRRFQSFSEAAESVVDVLTEAVPGAIVLTRLAPDSRVHRVIEAKGAEVDGLERGASLPPTAGGLDTDALRALGAGDLVSTPLEVSDGRIVGALCAVERGEEAYGPKHAAYVALAARLLGHEWESVELRSELRRLRGRVKEGPSIDPDTGLPGREGFLELLDQEWRMAEKGSVESVLVVCRIGPSSGEGGNGSSDAADKLALKLTADVMKGTTRGSDHVGRIGETTVAAILVGCGLQDTPAFVARFLGALERVTEGRREIEISCGVQSLGGTSSPIEVIGLAEAAAGDPGRAEAMNATPQAALE
jgi:GGDEF domain-containing protein